MLFTMTDLDTKEYSFLLGINDINENLLGNAHCSFYDGVSYLNSEIEDNLAREQRQYYNECIGYTPNIVSVTLSSDINLVNFEEILEKLYDCVDYALITYFKMIIPDLYICLDLTDVEVDLIKLKGLDEAIGYDLYADKNLLVLSRWV